MKYFRIGKIITTHGLDGAVKIYNTSGDEKRFCDLNTFFIINGDEASEEKFVNADTYIMTNIKFVGKCPVINFKNKNTDIAIKNVEEAQKFVGKSIYVDEENAIALSENEYYIQDLIGMDILSKGTKVGIVADIMQTSAQSIIVANIENTKNNQCLIPMVREFIEEVNVNEKTISIKNLEQFY